MRDRQWFLRLPAPRPPHGHRDGAGRRLTEQGRQHGGGEDPVISSVGRYYEDREITDIFMTNTTNINIYLLTQKVNLILTCINTYLFIMHIRIILIFIIGRQHLNS